MILYNPVDSDVHSLGVNYKPKTAFIMTQLGDSASDDLRRVRRELSAILTNHSISEIDATSYLTGRDFLLKIWNLISAVPLGIAIIDETMSKKTYGNIFYELGLMQSHGKETVLIRIDDAEVPSDFVRSEFIKYNSNFERDLNSFLDTFFDLSSHFDKMSDQFDNNPLLAIDYLRRAYLISGDERYREKAKNIFNNASIEGRAKNSVEMLLVNF